MYHVKLKAMSIEAWLLFPKGHGWYSHINDTVMHLERGIAAVPHSFKECRTDMKFVRHYAPLETYIEHYCYS